MSNSAAADRYQLQYYTGTQASIWVGDIWVDEVFGIQFQANQNIVPVFGYASRFFDAVGRGKVLVQGVFEINFVDEGYLYYILHERAKGLTEAGVPNKSAKILDNAEEGLLEVTERIVRLEETAEGLVSDLDLNRGLSNIIDELARQDLAGSQRVASQLRTYREGQNRPTQNIIYDMIPFKMMGVFGNPNLRSGQESTVKVLDNCFLVANEMVVGMDDQVIKERYTFIAQKHQ